MNFDPNQMLPLFQQHVLPGLIKLITALAIWMVGRWLIGAIINFVSKAFEARHLDPTLLRYLRSTIAVILNIALALGVVGYLGIDTTSVAALIAAAGFAIGTAWGGLLANFAAGVFLVILRPFKVGDFVSAGGVTGTIKEIGLFVTAIDTPDNIRTYVGNNLIFGANIENFSENPYRRVDLTAQLAHSTEPQAAIRMLKAALAEIPNVKKVPAPEVEILTFNPLGPVLAVRPFCHQDHYWQVYFDANMLIRNKFGEAGFAVPEQHYVLRQG
jgi:small conductance mechanosensitive channel